LGPLDVGALPIAQPFAGPAPQISAVFNLELQKALQEATIANDDQSCFGIEFIDFQDLINDIVNDDGELSDKFPDTTNACNNRFIQECDVCSDVLDLHRTTQAN